jgi:hypothetical protein
VLVCATVIFIPLEMNGMDQRIRSSRT